MGALFGPLQTCPLLNRLVNSVHIPNRRRARARAGRVAVGESRVLVASSGRAVFELGDRSSAMVGSALSPTL